jgi:GTPase SAR1 family protein
LLLSQQGHSRSRTLSHNHNSVRIHNNINVINTKTAVKFDVIFFSYYRGAMGIMLVYDITNDKSFDNIKNWIRNIEEHASADVEKMILGNKCDMNDKRQVILFFLNYLLNVIFISCIFMLCMPIGFQRSWRTTCYRVWHQVYGNQRQGLN